jgi:hypothetical protein
MPPQFKTLIKEKDDETDWVQMLIPVDDLNRIYNLMDEYAQIVENFNV